jgi:TfoX-like protein
MPHNQQLAERIRRLLDADAGVAEQRMFGGVAFLIGGNMAVSASGRGGLMVRVDPAESAALVSTTPARVVEMRGRAMPGWLYLEAAEVAADAELASWVRRGTSVARSLPAKPGTA